MFVAGCLSEELYATSGDLINHPFQGAGCNELESEKSVTDTDSPNVKMNDSTGEICSCSTEDSTKLSNPRTRDKTNNSNLPSGINSDTVEDSSEHLSQSKDKENKTYEQQGARPKVVDKSNPKNKQGSSNAHLSNKKRKELAKQEKKKEREERRKEDARPCVDPPVATGEQSTSAGLVADLGLLAI